MIRGGAVRRVRSPGPDPSKRARETMVAPARTNLGPERELHNRHPRHPRRVGADRRPQRSSVGRRLEGLDRFGGVRLLVRGPADEVDERGYRFRVADAFGVGVCLLSRFVPVTDDDL
jgi:hypothetical protein